MYIKNGINFERKTVLENENNGLIIVDINMEAKYFKFNYNEIKTILI